ncbi:MAG: alpha-galactosidase [Phycisphaerales bacterium]|nr:alpha-galactosidase [Phycisphaerales bacterium]
MSIVATGETEFQIFGDGYRWLLQVNPQLKWTRVQLDGVILPDWPSDITWQMPLVSQWDANQSQRAPAEHFSKVTLDHQQTVTHLAATYQTADQSLSATVHILQHHPDDVLEVYWTLQSRTSEPVWVDRLITWQFGLYSPHAIPDAFYLTGSGKSYALAHTQHYHEYHPRQMALESGASVRLQERAGLSCLNQHPWMYLLWPNERFTLLSAHAWSGNWFMQAGNDHEWVSLQGGLFDPDLPLQVNADSEERTPSMYVYACASGREQASNRMNRFIRRHLLPPERTMREYPTMNHMHYLAVANPEQSQTGQQMLKAAVIAKQLGHFFFDISVYWFMVENNWGDWVRLKEPTAAAFSPSFDDFCRQLKAMGLEIAAWFEPERVAKCYNQEFFERFPDGILHADAPDSACGLLNLGKVEIAEWVYQQLDEFIGRYNLDGIFYDHNFPHHKPHLHDHSVSMVAYYRNLYSILGRLRAKYPRTRILSCASGGRRVDLGILPHSHAFQISDGITPLVHLQQAWGCSFLIPMETIERYPYTTKWNNWAGNDLLRYGRFVLRSAMMGVFSSGNDYNSLSAAALELIQQHNQFYREKLVPILADCDVYRLTEPPRLLPGQLEGAFGDVEIDIAKLTDSQWFVLQEHHPGLDKHALFVFKLNNADDEIRLFPKALNGAVNYHVSNWDAQDSRILSGEQIIREGLSLTLDGHLNSAIVLLDRLPD